MIFLAEPNLIGNERKYLNECIDTTFVSSVGEFVSRIEKEIAFYTESEYGVAVSSGTAGLHMALKAFGVGRDELVFIPDLTFIATANAIAHCGAEPWIIDITKETWTMDPDVLEDEIENKTYAANGKLYHKDSKKRVAAIMPVYTLGHPADMDKISQIALKYNLPVIADAAAAIGAKYKNRNLGQLADATVFSFNGNKTITCGGGGGVVSNHREIAELVRHLSTTARCGRGYEHDMVGYNNRMTNLQASVGCAQLERLNEFIKKKRDIRAFYEKELSEIEGIKLFPEAIWAYSACWFSGIVLPDRYDINELCSELNNNLIEGRTFWKPIHLQKPYKDAIKSDIKIADNVWKRILTLPSSTGINEKQLEYVVSIIRKIFN